MNRFDVVGFGALNVDKLFKVNKIAAAEEESFITDFVETCGGSAANTMIGLARLGCNVGFVGKVAADNEGKMLIEEFCKEGVDVGGITITKQGRTGTVRGFVDEKGDRALYVDPGVNDEIQLNETIKKYASQTIYLHLTSFVGSRSFQTQEKIVQSLPSNVNVSFDPGALYTKKGLASLRTIIKKTCVVLPNERELELLTGETEYRKSAEMLLKEGVQIVAAKLGSKGCYIASREENCLIKPFHVRVVDTTGAGDAFDAGFLYGLIAKKSLYDCGLIGNFVASRCIMKMGARTALPTLSVLNKNGLA